MSFSQGLGKSYGFGSSWEISIDPDPETDPANQKIEISSDKSSRITKYLVLKRIRKNLTLSKTSSNCFLDDSRGVFFWNFFWKTKTGH